MNTVQPVEAVVTNPEMMRQLLADFAIPEGPLTHFKNVRARIQPGHEPGQSLVSGMIKAPTMELLDEAREDIRQAVEMLNQGGAGYLLEFGRDLPVMRQDQELIQQARKPIEAVVGPDGILTSYGAFPYNGEDFAYFLEEIPGAMFFLGVTNEERGIRGINHLPDYDVDEESILIGTKTMSSVLLNYLAGPPDGRAWYLPGKRFI